MKVAEIPLGDLVCIKLDNGRAFVLDWPGFKERRETTTFLVSPETPTIINEYE